MTASADCAREDRPEKGGLPEAVDKLRLATVRREGAGGMHCRREAPERGCHQAGEGRSEEGGSSAVADGGHPAANSAGCPRRLEPSRPGASGGNLGPAMEKYQVVHAIPGRIRLRPASGAIGASDLQKALDALHQAFPGATITVSAKTGSVLVLAKAPTGLEAKLAAKAKKRPKAAVGKGASTPAPVYKPARNPVPGKVRSFVYPRFFVYAVAVVRSIPYIFTAIKAVLRGRLNLDALDGAALAVCLLQRDFRSLSSITFFFALGEYLAEWTRLKSRASLEESLALNIEHVWVRNDELERRIPFAQLAVGDQVVVRAGEALPVDGAVLEGQGMVNQATMTGEPLPVHRQAGASVYAGTVLVEGELLVQATRVGSETRIRAIVRSIEESENVKASIQGRYEHVADAIVPYNFLLSGAVYAATRNPMRAGSVLLVDYSCAIRLATPLCIFTGMREAADRGVLIKGGKFMEAISEADVVIFDKTGTLTKARPKLVEVVPFGGRKRSTVLRLAACLEEHFVHPVGQAVVRASDEEGLKHREEHAKVEYIVAHGIASTWRNQRVVIGSDHFVLEDEKIPLSPKQLELVNEESAKGRSVLYLGIGGELAGLLLIEDEIRANAAAVVQALRDDGVKRVIMLTGDGEQTAASIAARAGVDEYRARLLPEHKARFVEDLKKQGLKVAMIGDGVNDSPALSAAHVGIAMADGADVAREVADIVLVNGNLEGLLLARRISRIALSRVRTAFNTSLLWNSIFLIGGLMGFLMPGFSAFLHNATTAAIAVSSVRPMLSPLDESAVPLPAPAGKSGAKTHGRRIAQ